MVRAKQPSSPDRAKTDDLAMKPKDAGLQSVADIQRQRARQAAVDQRESQALLAKARQARAEGKMSLAAHYYRSASLQADSPTLASHRRRNPQSQVRCAARSRISANVRGPLATNHGFNPRRWPDQLPSGFL